MARTISEPAPSEMLIGHWKRATHAKSSTCHFRRYAQCAVCARGKRGRGVNSVMWLDLCLCFVHISRMSDVNDMSCSLTGFGLARGVSRGLIDLGFAPLTELVPVRGLRVDVMALGPKGEIWVVECKSCRADFLSDQKWQGYLPYCDQFFWAVGPDFPLDLLPPQTGLFLADSYGAELIRTGPANAMAAPRRKALTHLFARHAARRLARMTDPRL